MQGAVMQRSSAFAGSSLRPSTLGRQCVSRTPVVSVQAVQDLKGTVVSTANNKTAVVGRAIVGHPSLKRALHTPAPAMTRASLGNEIEHLLSISISAILRKVPTHVHPRR